MLPVPLIQIPNTAVRTKLRGLGGRIDRYTMWAFNPPVRDRYRDVSR